MGFSSSAVLVLCFPSLIILSLLSSFLFLLFYPQQSCFPPAVFCNDIPSLLYWRFRVMLITYV